MYNMSTKKIFDDMYLYLREVNKKHQTSLEKPKNMDVMNAMPAESYAEFTSRFWNLIYRDPYHAVEMTDEEKVLLQGPDILAIDTEIGQ